MDLRHYSLVCNSIVHVCYFTKGVSFATFDKNFPSSTVAQKILLLFVIYFYSKEFVSLSQKLDR